jgi:hypothetical protein
VNLWGIGTLLLSESLSSEQGEAEQEGARHGKEDGPKG